MKIKKLTVTISCLASAVSFGVGITFAVRQQKIKQFKENGGDLPVDFTYTAHTGCMDTDDNSIASIEAAVASGADIVEFDLNFTESGVPVLSHHKPEGDEVTLDEAFKKVSEYRDIKVNVDIKSVAALQKVRPLAEKYGIADRIFFTGVNDEFVDAVRAYGNDIPYYLNVDVKSEIKHSEEYLRSLVGKVKQSGAIGINFNKNNASAELVKAFHSNGLLVSIWTVDSEYDMYRILSYAPDNVTTRKPDKLKEIINEMF